METRHSCKAESDDKQIKAFSSSSLFLFFSYAPFFLPFLSTWSPIQEVRARKHCGKTDTPNTQSWHSLPYFLEHQSRNPHDKNLLKRVTQQLSKKIKTIKGSSINKFLTELSQDCSTDYSLWKATKYLKRSIAQVPPIKKK
jgi:hypothetical protein